jgi:hypothetical protein
MPGMPRAAIAARPPDAGLPVQQILPFVGSFGSRSRGSFVWFSPLARRPGGSGMTTDTDRVIDTLRRSPGLHDDELASHAGIEPRLVNHICRYLEILGRLRRTPGPDGKIINILIDN